MKRSAGFFLIGGGLASLAAAWFAVKKSSQTTDAIKDALNAPAHPVAPSAPGAPSASSSGPRVSVHTTGYWPFTARADEKKMEGGVNDRKGKPLHTLEQHLKDPVAHPYVSVSGDDELWPYGQRLSISAWPTAIFRVVDTGSHFRGANKVFRVVGEEPLDICVDSSATPVPKKGVTATIFPGDNFASGKNVAVNKFKDQTIVTGSDAQAAMEILSAYYDDLERGMYE